MKGVDFFTEVENALSALRKGETILYPSDAGWGIGCDATSEAAITKLLRLYGLEEIKGFVVLVAEERDLLQFVAAPDLAVFDFIASQQLPTTVIFEGAIHLPEDILAPDGSVPIRIVEDEFCRHLIKRLRKPIVYACANSGGRPAPIFFDEINEAVKSRVDHIVKWRQADNTPFTPAQIVRWKNGAPIYPGN